MERKSRTLFNRLTSLRSTAICLCLSWSFPLGSVFAQELQFDVVFEGGRVIDPETGLDAVRNVGVRNGSIGAISVEHLTGAVTIDVSGLVVAPGFIDLHAHGQDVKANTLQAQDGVTTALELEVGTFPIHQAYAARDSKSILNYGYSVSHLGVRTQVLRGYLPKSFSEIAANDIAQPEQLNQILQVLSEGLNEGALGIGLGLEYSPGAGRAEVFRIFETAASDGVPVIVHPRRGIHQDPTPEPALQSVQELVANAAATGAVVHICHVTSTALKETAEVITLIDRARENGVNVTTEAYPYAAASTDLGSEMFSPGWQKRLGGISFSDLVWVASGEKLTESSFNVFRSQAIGGQAGNVIINSIPPSAVDAAIAHADIVIASDGLPWITGLEHPRGAGSFSRVLGRYVRERQILELPLALAKMTILPAKILEDVAPMMKKKGRIQLGADADITIFDPASVIDAATYRAPARPSNGIIYVLVGGTFVVRNGKFVEGVYPGEAIRGALF